MTVLEEINKVIRENQLFEFKVFSYSNGELVVVGSNDLIYYHTLEIYFGEVFSFIGNFDWTVDNEKTCLSILEGIAGYDFNIKYHVEIGNIIFEFNGEEEPKTYVIAKKIRFKENTVRYY